MQIYGIGLVESAEHSQKAFVYACEAASPITETHVPLLKKTVNSIISLLLIPPSLPPSLLVFLLPIYSLFCCWH